MKKQSPVFWTVLALSGFALGFIGIRNSTRAVKGDITLYLSTDCPVAARYTPRLNALYTEFAPKGFSFRALFPNDLETQDSIQRYARERDYKFETKLDLGGVTAKKDGVTHVPTVVVRDARGKMIYRGAIDDHKDPSLVKKRYLSDVLTSLSIGKPPKTNNTTPFGCLLMPGPIPPSAASVNYAEHVAPILNKRCVECHRPGEVAPFSLIGYENANKWAPMIAAVTGSKRMPPWKAVAGFGEFLDENRLNETELETLKRWSEAGAPKGDLSRAPKPPEFTSEWPLGKPDMILKPEKPFKLDADGADVYRNFVLKTDFKETKWVTAMAVRPGNPRVVHHVIAFLDHGTRAQKLAERANDGQPGYQSAGGGVGFFPDGSLGGWAPGLRPRSSGEDVAFELKPGTTIVLQTHYHKSGKPETDSTQVGIYFAKQPPKRTLELAWLANPLFRLKAGDKNAEVSFTYPIPADVTLYNVMPHMHLLGREMKAEVTLPDGSTKPIIYVDDWDFNWQLAYTLKQPLKIPKGSKIKVWARYDNSSDNPNNPNDPPKEIRWGEETTDEMFLLVAAYSLDTPVPGRRTPRVGFGGGVLDRLFGGGH